MGGVCQRQFHAQRDGPLPARELVFLYCSFGFCEAMPAWKSINLLSHKEKTAWQTLTKNTGT